MIGALAYWCIDWYIGALVYWCIGGLRCSRKLMSSEAGGPARAKPKSPRPHTSSPALNRLRLPTNSLASAKYDQPCRCPSKHTLLKWQVRSFWLRTMRDHGASTLPRSASSELAPPRQWCDEKRGAADLLARMALTTCKRGAI